MYLCRILERTLVSLLLLLHSGLVLLTTLVFLIYLLSFPYHPILILILTVLHLAIQVSICLFDG